MACGRGVPILRVADVRLHSMPWYYQQSAAKTTKRFGRQQSLAKFKKARIKEFMQDKASPNLSVTILRGNKRCTPTLVFDTPSTRNG